MDEADTRAKLEPYQALIGEWTIEMTHPMVEGTVVRGRTTFEWLDGGRFLIQRAVRKPRAHRHHQRGSLMLPPMPSKLWAMPVCGPSTATA